MSVGARIFVAVNFIILGLSFIATTVVLFSEYGLDGQVDWTALATYYSHLFIFFPTFGILALIAFYVPASILVDMYWTYVPNGRVRFSIGYVVAILLALVGGNIIGGGGGLKSIFEVKPGVLVADKGEPSGCNAGSGACQRASVLKSLANVRLQSTKRLGMSQFVRNCTPDDLFDSQPERDRKLHCFVTLSLVNADQCCRAQQRFGEALNKMHEVEANRSVTGTAHRYLLPLKVFFLLVVLAIAILLVIRHRLLEEHYAPYMKKLQRGVLIGASAMLVWPLMNLAFLQSSGLLYGTAHESVYRDASPVILAVYVLWALLLVFFFFKSFDGADKDMENMGRIGGIVGSAVFAFNYQTIVDYAVRFAGSGATALTLGTIFAVAVIALVAVVLQPKRSPTGKLMFDK
ncbi:MAG: hypothetical protein APF80_15260 [Alphaproteobacteria bacterium BRH_c36]|nr:MAG: hypothetical protein APF80_15260 [Alphaproteobacteria bacterium BRH_c36]